APARANAAMCRLSAATTGALLSTASAPPAQKSFCTSTTSRAGWDGIDAVIRATDYGAVVLAATALAGSHSTQARYPRADGDTNDADVAAAAAIRRAAVARSSTERSCSRRMSLRLA